MSDSIQERQVVVFDLANESYGVDIHAVREIIRYQPITALPDAPPSVVGVINLRGLVIPVIDLRKRLRLVLKPIDDDTRVVVVENGGEMVGLIVDAVTEVLRIPDASIQPAPTLSATTDSAYIAGVARQEHRLLVLLDLEPALSAAGLRRAAERERAEAARRPAPTPTAETVARAEPPAPETDAPETGAPVVPALSDLPIDLLEATFEAVKPRAAELVEYFYARLFEQHPSVVPLFANADMQEQQGKLLSALALVVASLREPDALVPALQRLGEQHVRYGAQPAHYDAVGAVLLESLAHIAGEAWTDEVAQAWTGAYTLVAHVMVEAATAVAEPAAA